MTVILLIYTLFLTVIFELLMLMQRRRQATEGLSELGYFK